MKACPTCKDLKDLIYFSPDKRTRTGVSSRCKSCSSLKAAEYRKLNPEKCKAISKKHLQNNYDTKLQYNNKYRKANPDKVAQWKKKDRQVNKIRIASDNAKRRALLSCAVTNEVLQMYALRDFYIEMSLGDMFHVDHIVAISKGGKHVVENLQVIPAIDNLRKGNK